MKPMNTANGMILAAAGLTDAEDVDEFSIMLSIYYQRVACETFAARPLPFATTAAATQPCILICPATQFKEKSAV